MKFVIFADKSYNFKRPLADGLAKTLRKLGHECDVYYDGIYWLQDLSLFKVFFIDICRVFKNLFCGNRKLYIYRWWNLLTFYNEERKQQLRDCDCIFVVENCPSSFVNRPRLDMIRNTYKKPIVSYDFHYLPNQGWWKYMQNGNYKGLEQFDWYLPVGDITEFPIPQELDHFYNCVGLDIKNENLYPEQNEFIVLLDFPRPGHENIRAKEKQMLDEIGIKYIELKGRYTTNDIRSIYRKVSAYIVSFRESFGLPIVELQLCGAKIFTPHKEWVPAHFLRNNSDVSDKCRLGSNFIVYSDENDFKRKITDLKESFDSKKNIDSFQYEYTSYYQFDINELNKFIKKIINGDVSWKSHEIYSQFNKFISLTDDYKESDI